MKSAFYKANVTLDGKDLYDDIYSKISTTTYSIINNHPMVDGNKRLGIAIMLILLKINNVKLDYTQKELIALGLIIARNECDEKCITQWIKNHENS